MQPAKSCVFERASLVNARARTHATAASDERRWRPTAAATACFRCSRRRRRRFIANSPHTPKQRDARARLCAARPLVAAVARARPHFESFNEQLNARCRRRLSLLFTRECARARACACRRTLDDHFMRAPPSTARACHKREHQGTSDGLREFGRQHTTKTTTTAAIFK